MKKYPYITIDEDKIGGFNYGNRGDQFYTQEKNIVSELSNYDLKGKIIYCNSERPTVSNVYNFFKNNFNDLGLKGLYASYYDDNPLLVYYNGSKRPINVCLLGDFKIMGP